MASKLALLSNFLLASAVLAAPSSQLAALPARHENRQMKAVNVVASSTGAASNDVVISNGNWAGALLSQGSGTFSTVAATFTVPTLSGSDGDASAWVGLDGYTCSGGILQTGVYFILSDGVPSYQAWYEWFPDPARDFSNFPINAGDVISAVVTATSTTTGIAYLENQTTGQNVLQVVSASTPAAALCEQDAEWIVENFAPDGNSVPLVDFGNVAFTEAVAIDLRGNVYVPSSSDANIFVMTQNGQDLTAVSTGGKTISIQYVGSVNVGPGS